MVSFWPWRSDLSSPASFEKTLSALSEKIARNQTQLDTLRTQSRRVRGLATLYLMLAYLLYGIVALLVIGQQNMGPLEWTGLAGGPVVIYTTRHAVAAFYNYRIESATTRLQFQQEERAKTIQKLKDATKYDSTLELLEKYGGQSRQDRQEDEGSSSRPVSRQSLGPQGQQQRKVGRTNLPPPPTANIQRGENSSASKRPLTPGALEPGAEFAPNAEFSPGRGLGQGTGTSKLPAQRPRTEQDSSFPTNVGGVARQNLHRQNTGPQFTQYDQRNGPQWYDRFLDLLLGEDEMAPRNRIVLICPSCRLVNGQAPPGTKSLAEMGTWKCMGCGSTNGEVDEGKKILKELMEEKKQQQQQENEGRTMTVAGGSRLSDGSSVQVVELKD